MLAVLLLFKVIYFSYIVALKCKPTSSSGVSQRKLICCNAGGKTGNVGFTYIERWYVVLHLGLSKYNFDTAWFLSYMLIFVSNV